MQEYPETLPVHAREAREINDRANQCFDTVVWGSHLPTCPRLGDHEPVPAPAAVVFSTSLTCQVQGVEVYRKPE